MRAAPTGAAASSPAATPGRVPGLLAGIGAGRIAAWGAAGLALVGGTALLAGGRGHRAGAGASRDGSVRGHVDPVAGHADDQDWDYGEHGPETGRGRPSTPASVESREAGHEIEDVNTRNLHRIMALFVAVALAAVFGMIALIGVWRANDRASRPKLTALQVAPIQVPGPHLQVDAYSDLNHERGREIGKLTGWAYTDAARTEARMPIEDAMRLVAGRPLDTPGLTRAASPGRRDPGPNPDVTQGTPVGTGQGSPGPAPNPNPPAAR
ncbi:MAG: hypothetical protein ACRYG6_05765 [Janthinobacterium lividum]